MTPKSITIHINPRTALTPQWTADILLRLATEISAQGFDDRILRDPSGKPAGVVLVEWDRPFRVVDHAGAEVGRHQTYESAAATQRARDLVQQQTAGGWVTAYPTPQGTHQ